MFQPTRRVFDRRGELDRLVAEKLETLAAEGKREGWKWVEIQPVGHTRTSPSSTAFTVYVPMSDEIRSEIEALQAEQEQIDKRASGDDEEYPPDVDKRMAEIETESRS